MRMFFIFVPQVLWNVSVCAKVVPSLGFTRIRPGYHSAAPAETISEQAMMNEKKRDFIYYSPKNFLRSSLALSSRRVSLTIGT